MSLPIRLSLPLLLVCSGLANASTGTGEPIAHFSGGGPESTAAFHVDGPWLLDWHASTDFPALSYLELHLYDATTDRLVGIALQHSGPGAGQRLIREGGDFRISVVGTGIDWSLDVENAPPALDALLERNPGLTEMPLVSDEVGLDRDIVGYLKSWNTVDGRTLNIETDAGAEISVQFYDGKVCPGLADAHNLFFVTSGPSGALFNAIMLENGTRCFFGGSVRLN